MVVDIGGGSTEFIIGSHYKALVTESLPLGCVSFTLRYFGDGKLSQANFQDAILAARNEIQRIAHQYQREEWQLAVGTSGTARCCATCWKSMTGAAPTSPWPAWKSSRRC